MISYYRVNCPSIITGNTLSEYMLRDLTAIVFTCCPTLPSPSLVRRTYWSSLVRYGRHHHPPVEYHTSSYIYLSISLSQDSKLFQHHSKQLADKLLEIAAQCNTRDDIQRLFPTLLDSPAHLLPPTLTRGGAQVLEAAFSHTLSQVSSQAGLTAEQSKLWSVFMSCGLDHLSTILPQDNDIGTYHTTTSIVPVMRGSYFTCEMRGFDPSHLKSLIKESSVVIITTTFTIPCATCFL